jgi:protein ImuB
VARIRVTQADTALLALARLQVSAAAGREPDQLPLHTLADARAHLATLERLGCQTWGELRALPRGGVVRRFGAPLLDALDRAYGLRPEVYAWLVLPEVFDQPLELMAQVETAPALLFAARRLLGALQVWLQARQHGVLAFELVWHMDARRDTATEGALVVRTAVPTLDMAHLQRLLAENLERVSLPAPVLFLRLRSVETAPLSGATDSLLPDEQRRGDDLLQLLERLAARLGPEQVLHAVARADHRPEHMLDWVSAVDDGALARSSTAGGAAAGRGGKTAAQRARGGTTGNVGSDRYGSSNNNSSGKKRRSAAALPTAASDALYPTWLLATPLKLALRHDRPLYQGPLTLLAGPQRLEAAWWDVVVPAPAQATGEQGGVSGAKATAVRVQDALHTAPAAPSSRLALRDYFLARSEQAGLLWIYRERLTAGRLETDKPAGHWYLHGVFG